MNTQKNIMENFGFVALTEEEMNEVRGGLDIKPKSRDKDVYDFDDE